MAAPFHLISDHARENVLHMNRNDDAWAKAQSRRWMHPNAHLWIRPDAYRFMAPDAPRLLGKDAVGYFWPQRQVASAGRLSEGKYSPDQPRGPAGNPEGGQWTSGGGGILDFSLLGTAIEDELQNDLIQLAQFGGTLTDADGYPYYRSGGHHEMSVQVYKE